ncbi:uncharacterized protein [Hetaerina americana]|uniref:uncharacterized protein isoform X2 n=1 Tax=Hetaerina americana TaxID=62018 RepID=UPI003A7F4976
MDAVNGLPNTTAMPGGDYPEGGVASRLKFPEDMSPSSGVRTMETDVTGRFTVTVEQEEGANEGEMITDDFFSANGRVVPKKEPVEDEPDRKEVTVEQEKGANEGEVITDDFFSVNGQVVPKKEPVEEEPDRKEALALAEDTPGCDRLEVFVNVEKDLGLALKSEGFSSEENDPLCLDGEILPHHVNQQREERSAEASASSILDNSSLPGTSSLLERRGNPKNPSGAKRQAIDPSQRRLVERHFIERIRQTGKKSRPQRRCQVCSARGKRRDTVYWCPDCNTGLCLEDCFKIYHTEQYF